MVKFFAKKRLILNKNGVRELKMLKSRDIVRISVSGKYREIVSVKGLPQKN
jgi:hypothetical protein